MDLTEIIKQIDAEIARLTQVRSLLAPTTGKTLRLVSVAKKKPRAKLSKEARAKIAAAQRKRWAEQKKNADAKNKKASF